MVIYLFVVKNGAGCEISPILKKGVGGIGRRTTKRRNKIASVLLRGGSNPSLPTN